MAKVSNGIATEIELLLNCCRMDIERDRLERIAALMDRKPDWSAVLDLARKHQVVPLLHRALRTVGDHQVPSDTRDQLAVAARRSAQRGLYFVRELTRIAQHFEEHAIPLLPFKGPLLATRVYGHIGLRECIDLDVLVPKSHVLQAKELLMSLGYRPEYNMGRIREALHLRFHCEYNFCRPGGLPLEVHWRLSPSFLHFPVKTEELWQRAVTVPFGKGRLNALSAEDLLLYLCVHDGGKHYWQYLRWVCDVAELVRTQGRTIQWNVLYDRARRVGCGRLLSIGLMLSRQLLGAPIPEEYLAEARRDRRAVSLTQHFHRELISPDLHPKSAAVQSNTVTSSSAYVSMRERSSDKLRYLPHVLGKLGTPTERDRAFVDLPRPLGFLYAFLRPIRLAAKYARLAWGALRRNRRRTQQKYYTRSSQ